jgi:hypothetical protein
VSVDESDEDNIPLFTSYSQLRLKKLSIVFMECYNTVVRSNLYFSDSLLRDGIGSCFLQPNRMDFKGSKVDDKLMKILSFYEQRFFSIYKCLLLVYIKREISFLQSFKKEIKSTFR